MKKITMTVAALAVSTLCACAAEVYSSNIVGYQKVNLNEGLNLVGSQFVNVGDEAALDINKVLETTDLPGLDENAMYQSTLMVWNGNEYVTYGWLDADDGTNNDVPEWNSTWLLYDMSDAAVCDMKSGDGFWIQTSAPATVTFSGQIITAETTDISVDAGLSLICNPYPQPTNIQSVQSSDLAGLDENAMYQSTLMVWNGSEYVTYGWLDADDGTNNDVPEWNSTWLLYDMSDKANYEIAQGEGFWIQTSAPATINFTK